MEKENTDRFLSSVYWLTMLAEQGSFTSAAKRLGVSKAAMSQRMAELEHAIGVGLIQRTTRSVRLTEAGQQLVDETRRSYEHILQSFANVQDLAATPSGHIRITAPVAFSRQKLAPMLPAFFREYPKIRVELDMNDELVSLARDGFDLALRHVETPPDLYVAHELCPTRTLLVASPSYVAAHGEPADPRDLVDHRHLLYPRQQKTATWSFDRVGSRGSKGRTTVAVQPYFVVNNSEVLRDMACAGVGIALLPDFSAEDALSSGELLHLLPNWRPVGSFGRKIFVLRPYLPNTPRAVKTLLHYLVQKFSGVTDLGAETQSVTGDDVVAHPPDM